MLQACCQPDQNTAPHFPRGSKRGRQGLGTDAATHVPLSTCPAAATRRRSRSSASAARRTRVSAAGACMMVYELGLWVRFEEFRLLSRNAPCTEDLVARCIIQCTCLWPGFSARTASRSAIAGSQRSSASSAVARCMRAAHASPAATGPSPGSGPAGWSRDQKMHFSIISLNKARPEC